jgi:hypothetical protein
MIASPFLAMLICVWLVDSGGPLATAATERHTLFPQLHAGQTFHYLIESRTEKRITTESRVFTPGGPQNTPTEAQWILRVEILDVVPQKERAAIHARTQFESVNAPQEKVSASEPSTQSSEADAKAVEFTIQPDGHVENVTGLDTLFPEQREVWQQWLRQFAIAAVFPQEGVKHGQTWKSVEPEAAPSPIIKLQWNKTAKYVRDERCAPYALDESGRPAKQNSAAGKSAASEMCAVVLTQAVLKQKSPEDDTTPGDFKLHNLQTSGNATGKNQTISYISLNTGLVVRVTEDDKQFMDVLIAKTDGSNQVHYNVDASSHVEVLLLAAPSTAPTGKPEN